MSTFKFIPVVALLASNLAQALPCDGFQIKIKNDLPDSIFASSKKLTDARIDPDNILIIKAHSERVLVVNQSVENAIMKGTFVFRTETLPVKTVKVNFDLTNDLSACLLTDYSPKSDYVVNQQQALNQVIYTIGSAQ